MLLFLIRLSWSANLLFSKMRKKVIDQGAEFQLTLKNGFEFCGYFKRYMTSPAVFLLNNSWMNIGRVSIRDGKINIAYRGCDSNITVSYSTDSRYAIIYHANGVVKQETIFTPEELEYKTIADFPMPERFPDWFTHRVAVAAIKALLEDHA